MAGRRRAVGEDALVELVERELRALLGRSRSRSRGAGSCAAGAPRASARAVSSAAKPASRTMRSTYFAQPSTNTPEGKSVRAADGQARDQASCTSWPGSASWIDREDHEHVPVVLAEERARVLGPQVVESGAASHAGMGTTRASARKAASSSDSAAGRQELGGGGMVLGQRVEHLGDDAPVAHGRRLGVVPAAGTETAVQPAGELRHLRVGRAASVSSMMAATCLASTAPGPPVPAEYTVIRGQAPIC